jgi:hypothetical protein
MDFALLLSNLQSCRRRRRQSVVVVKSNDASAQGIDRSLAAFVQNYYCDHRTRPFPIHRLVFLFPDLYSHKISTFIL